MKRASPSITTLLLTLQTVVSGRPKRPATVEAHRIIADVKAASRKMTSEAEQISNALADLQIRSQSRRNPTGVQGDLR